MKLDDFRRYTDLYSADLARWPAELVRPAMTLMKTSAEARTFFDRALALDADLREYAPAVPALEKLEDNIMRAVADIASARPRRVAAPAFSFRSAWLFAPGGGMVAAAILGFIVGMSPPQGNDALIDAVFYAPDQVIAGEDFTASSEGIF